MKKIILICAILSMFQAISQEKLEVQRFGFSIHAPKGWIEMKDEDILKNLNKFDLTDDQLEELLKSNHGSISLVTYSKYDPKKYAGIIPTIKIRAQQNPNSSIENFLKSIENSTEDAMKTLENFKFSEKPVAVKISNKNAVKFAVQFTMKSGAKEYEIVSHSYYILIKDYFISLNFIEQVGKEDNSKLFDELFQSIQITK